MIQSIRDFSSAAAIGGQLNIQGPDKNAQIVNSNTNFFSRAVSWIKSQFASAETKAAQGTENQRANDAFVTAMQKEYGQSVADRILREFGIDSNSTKPLESRDIRSAIKAADDRKVEIQRTNGGFKVMYEPALPAMTQIFDSLEPRVRIEDLSKTQHDFIKSEFSARLDAASGDNSKIVSPEEAKEQAVRVARLTVAIGEAGATAALDGQKRIAENAADAVKIIRQGGGFTSEKAMRLVDGLLATKRAAEDSATARQRPLNGAEDTLMELRAPMEKMISSMSKEDAQALRNEMLRPDGLVKEFMLGSLLEGKDNRVDTSTDRSRTVLLTMVDLLGQKIGLRAAERIKDVEMLVDQPPVPSENASFMGEVMAYRLLDKTYDAANLRPHDLLSSDNERFVSDFCFFAEKKALSPEYIPFLEAARQFEQAPSLEILASIEGKVADENEWNLSGADRTHFLEGLAALRTAYPDNAAPEEQLKEVFQPVRHRMLENIGDLFPRFRQDAAQSRHLLG